MKLSFRKRKNCGKSIQKRIVERLTGTERVRVAVMGAKRAGKTVLITALDNLIDYLAATPLNGEMVDAQKKILAGWNCIDKTKCQNSLRCPEFDATAYKKALSSDKNKTTGNDDVGWPKVTIEPAMLAYEFDLAREGEKKRIHLEILDMPGERVTDVATMWNRSYDEWCEIIFKIHSEESDDVLDFRKYEEAVKGCEAADKICEAYKKFIASQALNYSPLITPSEALLDREGNAVDLGPQDNSVDEIVKKLHNVAFAPLPGDMRRAKKYKPLVRKFEKAYESYLEKIRINDLVRWMSSVDQVYYLVDVLDTLAGGKSCYYGVAKQIKWALAKGVGRTGCSRFARLFRTFFGNSVSKVCAVATQIDRVCLIDQKTKMKTENEKNCERLLRTLFKKTFEGLPNEIMKAHVVCSAVASTITEKSEDGEWLLKGTVEADGKTWHQWPPSLVPEEWYDKPQVKYFWPRPKGDFRRGEYGEKPQQYNLDKVLRSILNITEDEYKLYIAKGSEGGK